MTPDPSGRVAALDLGEAYCGVAISDPGASLARPLEVVPAGELMEYLRPLLADGVAEILVGVPKTLGGEVGFQAEKALATLGMLREEFPETRFVEWDERLTTRLVRSPRDSSGKKGRGKKGKKERVDHLAAAAMLQEYLDRRAV